MSQVEELLKKYPEARVVHEKYELGDDNFNKQKLKLKLTNATSGAVGFIWVNDSEFILTKRTGLHPGWALLGGTVEAGENFDQAIIREAKEEAGVDIEIIRLVKLEDNTYTSRNNVSLKMFLAFFEAKVKNGSKVLKTKEAFTEGLEVKVFNKISRPRKMILKDSEKVKEILSSL